MTAKLWISSALTPNGSEYGLVAVTAETREEALAKVNAKLSLGDPVNYVPNRRHAQALLDNLDAIREVEDEVFIDWDAASLSNRKHGEGVYPLARPNASESG